MWSFFMAFFTFRHFAGSRFLTETAEKLPVISGRKTADKKTVMGGIWGKFMPQDAYSVEQAILTLMRCYGSCSVEEVYAYWINAP